MSERALRRSHLPALCLFLLITLIMTWPYPRQIETSLYNWSDALLNTWTLAWGAHALLTDPLNLYNANIFYPYPNTLAYSESLLPQTVLALPVLLASDMPALAHNLLALSSFVLAAFGMYLLAFDLTRSRAAGLVAGMVYTFTSYKMMHFAHLQLLSSQWLPFALLYLRKTLTPALPRSPRDGMRAGVLFALFFSLQALSSFYYAFFIAIAVALYVAYVFARWVGKRRSNFGLVGFGFLPALALIAILTLPFALPYFSVQHDLGLERGLSDAEYYAATLRTYFSVPDGNWLYAAWLAPTARLTGSGERDFIGFVALGLALVGLVARPRRDGEKWFYALLAAVGILLSFGARNQILLFPKLPALSLPFYLPYRYLFEWVPGFKAMRGPDRFAYLAVLGAAVLAAYGTRALVARPNAARPALAGAAPLALVALIGLENLAIPIRATNPATLARPLPGATQFLAQAEPGAVVLELPVLYDGESPAWPQYYSIFHWRKLVNGFSGFFPPGYDALAGLTRSFPDAASLALLEEIGVRYVVVHTDLLTGAESAGLAARLPAFAGRVDRVLQSGSDEVYRLDDNQDAWGAALASAVPPGARVWLDNTRPERREFFEIAAAFLPGRELDGGGSAAFRALTPPAQDAPPNFAIANADDTAPAGFTRRVWANDILAVYAR